MLLNSISRALSAFSAPIIVESEIATCFALLNLEDRSSSMRLLLVRHGETVDNVAGV